MQPKKYIKDLESSQRRSEIFSNLKIAALFMLSFLLLGQLIHEGGHILALKLFGCNYDFTPGFSFLSGFTAQVKPLCFLNAGQSLIFYSIGYISTILVGGLFGIAAFVANHGKWLRAESVSVGTGMLMSILLSIGSKGDVQQIVRILELSQPYNMYIVSLVILGVISSSLGGVKLLAELEGKK